MNCPKCHSNQINTVDSRPYAGSVRRRRKCLACDYRFNTFEVTVERFSELIKKEGVLTDLINYIGDVNETMKGKENED